MRALAPILILCAACVDRGVTPPRRAAADSADQVYDTMTFSITRNGVAVSRVKAESAWVYQQRQVADLKNMTVTFFDTTGATISTVTADKGIYGMRQQTLDARGHVVATSSGGKVLKTEHLVYDQQRNLISSDTLFTSTSPQGTLNGSWFESDPSFKTLTVNRPRGGQRGKGFLLPGQHDEGARKP